VENYEQFGYIKLKISHNIVSELRKGSWITAFLYRSWRQICFFCWLLVWKYGRELYIRM